MATRIKEGFIPYTGGDGIEITDNHVINVLLRAANNLIHVNEDRELYVDLQLPAGIAPDDEFPVGVTTGEILAEDGWEQSGTIINSKTTSGDYVRLIYANDGNLYYDPGTGVWIMIGTATAIDVNTKTFFLTGTTGETNLAAAQAACDWWLAGKNPLIMYNDRCYVLVDAEQHEWEGGVMYFASVHDGLPYSLNSGTPTISFTLAATGQRSETVESIGTGYIENANAKTQTFYIRSGDTASSRGDANIVLAWYKKWNPDSWLRDQIYSPRILTTDALGDGPHIYELENASSSQLIFVSQILTEEAPNDLYVSKVILNYSGSTVTSITRNDYEVTRTYTAGSGISIDSDNVISANIQGALVYKGNVADVASLPATGNTVGDVYYVEADGVMYAWDGTAWKAVGNTQIDLSNYFDMTVNTTDDITQGSTNLFVTQAMIDAWNGKQGALTAGTNIQINNGVISATDTTYSAGTGIGITGTTINNTAPFSPENAGSVGQVLKRTSTGVRWSNSMTASGASFGAFITECKNNGTKHVTTIRKHSSYSEDDLGSQSYTMQGNGYFNVRIYSTRGSVASVAINGEVIIERTSSDSQGTYEVDQINLITVSQGDVVTVSLDKYAGLASATIYDYY